MGTRGVLWRLGWVRVGAGYSMNQLFFRESERDRRGD